jgi:hypothetical protein
MVRSPFGDSFKSDVGGDSRGKSDLGVEEDVVGWLHDVFSETCSGWAV